MEGREIKFRAWYNDTNSTGMSYFSLRDMELFKGMIPHACGEEQLDLISSAIELMQFTGLKDKNGKEIYEGDIVLADSYGKMKPHEVYADVGRLHLRDMRGEDYDNGDMEHGDDVEWMQVEVIGNIYDNPELLQDVE